MQIRMLLHEGVEAMFGKWVWEAGEDLFFRRGLGGSRMLGLGLYWDSAMDMAKDFLGGFG